MSATITKPLPLAGEVLEFVPSPSGVYLLTEYDFPGQRWEGIQYVIHQRDCRHMKRVKATAENRRTLPESIVLVIWDAIAKQPMWEWRDGVPYGITPTHGLIMCGCTNHRIEVA